MRTEQNKKIPKNKQINQNSLNIDIEEVNKAIELTRFNVSILNFINYLNFQKINAKNAFDINVGFIESITNMLAKNEKSTWQKASASLDRTAKIYRFRVDSVHTETYKFLGGLNRNKKELNPKEGNIEGNQEEIEQTKKN